MQLQNRHNPAFTVGRLYLAPNEPVRVESGAMMATSAGVKLDVSTGGGIMAGLKRSVLAGESFFVTTYTAPPQGGWVDVCLLYTSPSPRDGLLSRMPSSA